jgi:uncharacterized protein (TIGR02217 family)
MSFVEVQFPTDISFGSTGGPAFSTDVVTTYGGHEQRNANWLEARGRWNVAHGAKTPAQIATLLAFFRARRGKAVGFRFKDWSDYAVVAGNIGTGNGSATTFQLRKQYSNGGVTINRTITKPVAGTLKIYLNGTLKTSGVTVDTTTGVVTLSPAPSSGVVITADVEFDVPARFDIDQMMLSLDTLNLSGWNDIPIVELRI